MGVKTLNFKVNLKSTTPELIYSRHKVYTNDDNAVKLEFAIQDFTTEELTAATASLLLYMRDGSFFQIENTNIDLTETTFSYTLQGTQGKHDGVAQAQLLVTIGTAELATQKYEFEIISGLDQAVAVEVMIQDWTTLTAEARAFIDQAELDEAQRIANENDRIAAENQRINDFSSKADKTYADEELLKKVDKVDGKGLSTNDFDNTYKQKIDTDIPAQLADIENAIVKSVNNILPDASGNVSITAGGAEIDDTVTSIGKTWSSSKIDSTKSNKVQEAWITPTLLNGVTGNIKFLKDTLGFVHFQGDFTMLTKSMLAMPVGYRPSENLNVTTSRGGRIGIWTDGIIRQWDTNAFTDNSLNHITYKAV